ncbi:hypothetical protein DINM_000999 [Dirofilaria immitis]|nr:hypothetical protein [Dirofilaria immitis]
MCNRDRSDDTIVKNDMLPLKIGASKFSRRRIDLSRQVANKMATRRSVDYSNEYGTHGWTPRPSEVSQAAWFALEGTHTVPSKNASHQSEAVSRLRNGVKHNQQCAVSPPRKTVGWNTLPEIRASVRLKQSCEQQEHLIGRIRIGIQDRASV